MDFYERQYNEGVINRNLYSSNTYSFYHRHQQKIHVYFTKLEEKRLQKRIDSFKKNEENTEKEEKEDKENEMIYEEPEEKNIEQTMDEKTRKRLYEIRKQGSFMISDNNDNNDNNFYEISF